ncbi:MAG TPA: hypothetical protein VMZ69_08225 [Saprospiraceae bacterium]|nr:hypothetical protein [Saprospiraceae bacterium]
MGIFRLPSIFLLVVIGFMMPLQVRAVNSECAKETKIKDKEAKEEKKMDELSLIAYVMTVAGVASFFLVPVASLFLFPVAFVLGAVAFLSGKKRYKNRRGRGLALAAMALGGIFTLFLLGSFLAFALFGF